MIFSASLFVIAGPFLHSEHQPYKACDSDTYHHRAYALSNRTPAILPFEHTLDVVIKSVKVLHWMYPLHKLALLLTR